GRSALVLHSLVGRKWSSASIRPDDRSAQHRHGATVGQTIGWPFSAFLRTWLGLKVSTRRAEMVISSPVCGFRPIRAFFSRTTTFPNPEILIFSPDARVSLMQLKTISTISAASFLENPPTFSYTDSMMSALVISASFPPL